MKQNSLGILEIENKRNGSKVLIMSNGMNFLIVKESDPKFIKEAGWYILRAYDRQSFRWTDYARPGYGESFWLRSGVVKELEL